jgi:hypothetical protein
MQARTNEKRKKINNKKYIKSCGLGISKSFCVLLEYLLECQLYYNQRIPLFNDLLNMNIQHNIETVIFGNDTHNDLTNSKSFFYDTHKKILIFQVRSF